MSHDKLGEFGPYSVPQLRELAQLSGINATVQRADNRTTEHFAAMLDGKPLIILWRDTPDFGHFIVLLRRWSPYGDNVEVFDPVGFGKCGEPLSTYLNDPKGLNGGGLCRELARLDSVPGMHIAYNPGVGPQGHANTNSCGLWCLVRAAVPFISPEQFNEAGT